MEHSPAAISKSDNSKTWAARSLLGATKTVHDEAIPVTLRRSAPEPIFSVAVAPISRCKMRETNRAQFWRGTRGYSSAYSAENPSATRWASQGSGNGIAESNRSRVRSIGWRPSRIASVMSGARNASGIIRLGYVRCTFSALARSEIDSTFRFLSISNQSCARTTTLISAESGLDFGTCAATISRFSFPRRRSSADIFSSSGASISPGIVSNGISSFSRRDFRSTSTWIELSST